MTICNSIEEFADNIHEKQGVIIAIDYGSKKVGIAISSPSRSMSLPLGVIENKGEAALLAKLASIIEQRGASGIVLGLPVHIDGSSSKSSDAIKTFAAKLSNLIKLPMYLQEERRTSRAADSLLKIAGMKRIDRNQIDDKVAASLILDSVLNGIAQLQVSSSDADSESY